MAKADKADEGKASAGPTDVALIAGVSESGALHVVRQRDDRVEFGAIRPLREGMPITGELVRLVPRREFPLLCDVKTEFKAPTAPSDVAPRPSSTSHGPAQVASERYRENWDRIWAAPKSKGELSN